MTAPLSAFAKTDLSKQSTLRRFATGASSVALDALYGSASFLIGIAAASMLVPGAIAASSVVLGAGAAAGLFATISAFLGPSIGTPSMPRLKQDYTPARNIGAAFSAVAICAGCAFSVFHAQKKMVTLQSSATASTPPSQAFAYGKQEQRPHDIRYQLSAQAQQTGLNKLTTELHLSLNRAYKAPTIAL